MYIYLGDYGEASIHEKHPASLNYCHTSAKDTITY